MIDPKTIDLTSLPWLPLSERSAFPRQPAIYFAIDSLGEVQYIGISKDPKQRWSQHHRYKQLQAVGQVKIAYLFVEDIALLKSIESALIAWFCPPLNVVGISVCTSQAEKIPVPGGMKVRRIERREIEIPDLSKQIADAQRGSGKPVSEICKKVGFSRAYWYQVVNDKEEAIAEETLRKIEEALGVDFGVQFD